jgi:hypothetical protein
MQILCKSTPINLDASLLNTGNLGAARLPVSGTWTLSAGLTISGYPVTIASLIGNKIYPAADSTTAVQINKADGTTNVLNVDTTNGRVGIGTTGPSGRLSIKGFGTGDNYAFYVSDSSDVGRFAISDNGNVGVSLAPYGSFLVSGSNNANFPLATFTATVGNQSGGVPLVLYANQGAVDVTTLRLKSSGTGPGVQNRLDFYFGDLIQGRIASEIRSTAGADLTFSTRLYPTPDAIAEVMRITKEGNVGIGTTAPTAYLHLKAGTATANTAPLKLTKGVLNTTAEIGAIEFVDDDTNGALYMTFNVGGVLTRKQFAFV